MDLLRGNIHRIKMSLLFNYKNKKLKKMIFLVFGFTFLISFILPTLFTPPTGKKCTNGFPCVIISFTYHHETTLINFPEIMNHLYQTRALMISPQ